MQVHEQNYINSNNKVKLQKIDPHAKLIITKQIGGAKKAKDK